MILSSVITSMIAIRFAYFTSYDMEIAIYFLLRVARKKTQSFSAAILSRSVEIAIKFISICSSIGSSKLRSGNQNSSGEALRSQSISEFFIYFRQLWSHKLRDQCFLVKAISVIGVLVLYQLNSFLPIRLQEG